jgi:hypothetical protein
MDALLVDLNALRRVPSQARPTVFGMSLPTTDDRPAEAVSHLLSLGLTQLSIQVTLSTSLTASALGLAALATALTSTILTVQGGLSPDWQWTLLPSAAATITGLLATAVAGAENIGQEEVYVPLDTEASSPEDVSVAMLRMVRNAFLANARALRLKDRLTAIALAWLALSMFLIGVLNLTSATLH